MIKELHSVKKGDTNYKRFKDNKLFFRTRGLDKLQERFDEDIIGQIQNLSKIQKEVRVLEIGFGEGKALLEAMSLGPNIYGYGVNDKKRSTLASISDIMRNSKTFDIETNHKPKIFFYDAGYGLKFKDDYFDVVFSQVAIHYVGDKAKLFEEIWRVLKNSGHAYLHIDSQLQGSQPDFMYYYNDTPRLIVYNGKKSNKNIISTKTVFDNIRKKGYDIRLNLRKDVRGNMTLVMHKNTLKKLNLELEYDGNSTIYLSPLRESDKYKSDTGIWWGTRSVYKAKK